MSSEGTADFAWDARFAGQSTVGPRCKSVKFFDKQKDRAALAKCPLNQGDNLAISIDGLGAQATTAAPRTSSALSISRPRREPGARGAPVAVAETVDALNDQTTVVNIRQNGVDNPTLGFYRVDDFTGKIAGLAPGAAGYEAAAQGRAYQTTTRGDPRLTAPATASSSRRC